MKNNPFTAYLKQKIEIFIEIKSQEFYQLNIYN